MLTQPLISHAQVLSQLGVWVLDAQALGNQAQNPLVLKYVNACSPSGVLSALQQALFPPAPPLQAGPADTFVSPPTAALPGDTSDQRQQEEQRDFGPGGAARRKVDNRFVSVAPAERDALRDFLSRLQRTGGRLTDELTELLKSLPIYRVHGGDEGGTVPSAIPLTADERRSRQRGAGAGAGQFTSISGAERLLLAPRNTDPALLGPTFAVERFADTELLESLGVQRVAKGVFFREHVLPRAGEERGVEQRSLHRGELAAVVVKR